MYWWIGVKSFKLKEEYYIKKTTKPSAKDRELMAINAHRKIKRERCTRCQRQYKISEIEPFQMTLEELRKTEAFKYEQWYMKAINSKEPNFMFDEVCFHFLNRDMETEEAQDDIGHLAYTLQK